MASAALSALLGQRPDFHGWGDQPTNWQAGDDLLHWLEANLTAGSRSLETGCGYSTVVFAAAGGRHTVVSPVPAEHERIQAWCAANGVDLAGVSFIAEPSDRWLPTQPVGDEPDLDLVLIDGAHGYPVPAIDSYHTAPRLRVGGLLVVDDVHIRACREVGGFLDADRTRWRREQEVDGAWIYRKLALDVTTVEPWRGQPWNRIITTPRQRATALAHGALRRIRRRSA